MSPDELLALGASTDIPTSCRALGISPSSGYAQAKKGEFPVRVIRVGSRYVVPTAGLLDLLGIERPVTSGAA
ncbi:DNA-binding protein [Rhodococcus sp. I2R]|uniref:DNA-binding protein n=1 Tax=Rhodococcus sp. I2R TaxID=2855445 RepID=UPI001E2C874F|nr:DNA-binding protein [Rhodococcus sp. I2R]MCC8929745.1 DNA-binding protein [Rhodococcus sp. I2R]